jgi:hypothetical protein
VEPQAVQRLQMLGNLFLTIGAASLKMGEFLRHPALDRLEECSQEVSNLFEQAAEWCDKLAALNIQQESLGEPHGYTAEDSAALATLKSVFHGFGVVPVSMCTMEFTMPPDEKASGWRNAGVILRKAADASWRQRELLASAMTTAMASGIIGDGV